MPTLADLKAELDAGHPDTGPYDPDNRLAAQQLNTVNRKRNLDSLTGDQLFDATDGPEFAALDDAKKQLWLIFTMRDAINPFGGANGAFVRYIFGPGSTTIRNLAALRRADVSRAEELGFRRRIRPGLVAEARAL